MSRNYRLVFSLLMSLSLSFLMTAWVTWINLGFVDGFIWKWGAAFITAWPAAAVIAFAFGPFIHQMTTVILSKRP
ncbi:MAG: hypothetical protein CVV16_02360 [Gammaproteobacteria bacterium HGW-Gammaproteobacteria-6]|nr:MAG: hypothetical protein CVV16_02360 [Gammaproteobacteria bacterium HGW-Gammaproteobacteria-6]